MPRFQDGLYTPKGVATYFVKSRLTDLVARIERRGLISRDLIELREILRGLNLPRRGGMCPIEGHYIMTIKEGQGVYKNSIDPYINCEVLSGCIADAVFETMKYILKSAYDLDTIYDLEKQKRKWEIFHFNQKVGDLFYDIQHGFTARRLRASMTNRMIVICWRRQALSTEVRIHFNPKERRRAIREEILPVL
jgi:hypothetical protein